MSDKGNKFIKGAAVLGIAGVLIKLLGAVFRIPLTNWIGDDGMSYYGFAYSIYSAPVSYTHLDVYKRQVGELSALFLRRAGVSLGLYGAGDDLCRRS